MLFSIVVPVFNCRNSLRTCLDSILAQNYPGDFEVVAINDGSTDGSGNILESYATKDPRIRAFHFENAGVSIARKRGIARARGDYIVFVDSDDTINPNLLDKLYLAIIAHNYPTIIRFQANLVGDPEHKNHERYNFMKFLDTPYDGITALKLWSQLDKKYAVFWLFAFKRELFSKIPFDTTLRCYEDVALIPILIAASEKVVNIDYVGYNYTCDNYSSLTHTRSESAELTRALNFIAAYQYAIENFSKLDNVSSSDIIFFIKDYTLRLCNKIDSLPDCLKHNPTGHFET